MNADSLSQEWFRKAEMDIATALFMRNYHPVPIDVICYHCQQAGEKVLKGILAASDSVIPRTHRLEVILDLISPFEPSLINLKDDCIELSPYATISRYPSHIDLIEYDMKTALDSLWNILSAALECGYSIHHDDFAL
jgi:HEPN domain-containing protein